MLSVFMPEACELAFSCRKVCLLSSGAGDPHFLRPSACLRSALSCRKGVLTHRTHSPEDFAYSAFSHRECVFSPGFPFGRRDHALCFPPKRRGRVPRSIPPQPRFRSAFLSRKAYIAFAGAAFLHDLPFFCEHLPDKRRFFRFLMHFPRKKPRIRLGFSPF